jgi:photosystem II stability/assembly factor-like uncharacterized protein
VRAAQLVVLIALAGAGCGGTKDDPPAQPPPKPPQSSATPGEQTSAPPAPQSAANAFIGSIAVDPADGTVMLGTGLGLFRLDKGAKEAERVTGEMQTADGAGQISSNLVVRYAGPKDLLGSGHPDGGSLPENLGLMRSSDHGATWEPVSMLGKADFHILQVAHDRVVAVNADAKQVQVSTDGGKTFAARTPPDVPVDVAFDASDPKRMVVATKQGVFTSLDEGGSWRARDPTATQQLAWGAADALYRADPGGSIKRSSDGGQTWDEAGNVGAPAVNELALDDEGALYASIPGGEVKVSTDGGATWTRLVKLE